MAYLQPKKIVTHLPGKFAFFFQNPLTSFCSLYLLLVMFLAIFGPRIVPYETTERIYQDGSIARSTAPSLQHPLGTTDIGYDVFSRIVVGARPTIIAGFMGGILIVTIGSVIGLISGYYQGKVGNILMRITDLFYSIPVIPFAIVLSILIGQSFISTVLILGLIFWRSTARVIRSQTIQIKERAFITAAKATGASDRKIITNHIIPNVAPIMALYFALGIGATIITQAGLAFVGVSDPFVTSWGVMIRNAFGSGRMVNLWWWSISPGIALSLTVTSTYLLGRQYELDSKANESGGSLAKGGV